MPTMSCERATVNEECQVKVQLPKTFAERRQGWENALTRVCVRCDWLPWFICVALFATTIVLISSVIYLTMRSPCYNNPGLNVKGVNIHDMVLYKNSTTDTAWKVKSDMNINLTVWNPNTVAECFITYHLMEVYVSFKHQILLRQEVQFVFKLEPQGKRLVALDLQGDGYKVQQDLGSLLQLELENAVDLNFSFDARFLMNYHKNDWFNMCCDLMAYAPTHNSSSQLNLTGGQLNFSSCSAC